MIPQYLRIKGLYSYQTEQVVDFEKLTSASLFGIFGSVGSGKSSILEAITFALYGSIERLNAKEKRNYNMMNLRSDELLIDFVCRAGQTDQKYRFTVKGKRNSKRFEDVGTFERKVYQWLDELNDWSPIAIENPAEKIMGLDYDNFKRTIIIPQGNFQEFIELGGKDKSEMMQRIFGLDKFDLGNKVGVLVSQNKEKLAEIEGKLSGLGDANSDILEQKQHDLKLKTQDAKDQQAELTNEIAKEKSLEDLRIVVEEYSEATKKLALLKNQEEDYKERTGKLERYERCVEHLKALLEIKKTKTLENERDTKALVEREKAFKQSTQGLIEENEALGKVKPYYDKRAEYQDRANDFGHLLSIAKLTIEQQKDAERANKGQEFVTTKNQEIEQLRVTKLDAEATWQNQRKNAEQILSEYEKETVHLKVQQSLQRYAEALKTDEPCPLCGSVHHPAVLQSATNFDEQIIAIETKKQALKQVGETLEKNVKAIEKAIEKATEERDKFEKAVNDIKTKLAGTESSIATHKSQLKYLQWDDFARQSVQDIENQQTKAVENYTKIIDKYEQLDKAIRAKERQINTLAGEITTFKNQLKNNQESLAENQEKLQTALAENSFSSEEEVERILALNINTQTERKEINEFTISFSSITATVETLRLKVKDKPYDAEQHQLTKNVIEAKTDKLKILQKEIGSLETEIKRIETEIKTQEQLLKEKDKLAVRADNLNTLASLFKAKGFVDFISSVYLKNLCQAANERFHRMTSQQLHLEVNENNDFEVRDLLNGGKTRLLKTLSGGQKFQAALSLALALADTIHVRHQSKHNFFFLDEGFGSLDKQSLQVVFETLHSLRKENRIVGIISHVEELQQEIPAFLKVENSEEGSQVKLSFQ